MTEKSMKAIEELVSTVPEYSKEQPPLDGTWISAWDFKGDRIIQFDQTAFGGKGAWFNQKGHATKGPDPSFGWKPYLQE